MVVEVRYAFRPQRLDAAVTLGCERGAQWDAALFRDHLSRRPRPSPNNNQQRRRHGNYGHTILKTQRHGSRPAGAAAREKEANTLCELARGGGAIIRGLRDRRREGVLSSTRRRAQTLAQLFERASQYSSTPSCSPVVRGRCPSARRRRWFQRLGRPPPPTCPMRGWIAVLAGAARRSCRRTSVGWGGRSRGASSFGATSLRTTPHPRRPEQLHRGGEYTFAPSRDRTQRVSSSLGPAYET